MDFRIFLFLFGCCICLNTPNSTSVAISGLYNYTNAAFFTVLSTKPTIPYQSVTELPNGTLAIEFGYVLAGWASNVITELTVGLSRYPADSVCQAKG